MSFLDKAQRFAGQIFRPETATYGDGTTGIGPVADGDTYARRLGRSRFMDNFRGGANEARGFNSYTDAFKKEKEKDRMAGQQLFAPRGNPASGELVDGLSIYDEKALYPTGIIQGQAGTPGLFSARGAIGGGIKGFIGGGPAGALGGALMGGFG
tara:strand:- start:34 stop:495 length:462 start_codon:yes stop_codon:yes gene_type:complete